MSNFFDLVDVNNRIKYDDLKTEIAAMPLLEFMQEVGMPFLIGKELFEGDMLKGADATDTSTMRFSMSGVKAALDIDTQSSHSSPTSGSAISRAVYIVTKGSHSNEERRNLITIGRASTNDITIADYVISKSHAMIHCTAGHFFIEDLGSTNGVKVDGIPINSGEKVQLTPGVDVSFGRYCFVFTKPMDLYNKIRKEVAG